MDPKSLDPYDSSACIFPKNSVCTLDTPLGNVKVYLGLLSSQRNNETICPKGLFIQYMLIEFILIDGCLGSIAEKNQPGALPLCGFHSRIEL